jgi:riboflavin biosynthesis pyrimidine reductase
VSDPAFDQLLPSGPAIDATSYVEGLELGEHPDRPYMIANLVISADGLTAFDGRSAPLSDPADRVMFHALRARVDAILAGTETMRIERYGRTIPDPKTRAARLAAGRSAEPLAVLISRSGQIPLEIPLFAEPEAQVIVFSASPLARGGSGQTPPGAATVTEVITDGPPDLADAMQRLRHDHGVKLLLCEGGPTLFALLNRARLIDELFLTLAPKLAGLDGANPLATGHSDDVPPLPQPDEMHLRSVLVRKGTVFLRYVIPS